ncbi:pyrroloquinoline quinone precursor peptide PqqA [Streptomyces longispororuber]|nr:pyrroloquinoline quinone precursor peptide PqqA [Streptomyces longispororuber]MCQ4209430.1 pyrroloquinoline quinone precursor peptide PqqA [Streptomyces longispororuber]
MQDHTLPQPQSQPAETPGWQTPDFTIVDTAMEISAYALSTK